MAKTASDKPSTSADEALKQRKKQARREAKLMLAIEKAKKDLKKAQKNIFLHTLETRLTELHAQARSLQLRHLHKVQSLNTNKSNPYWRTA